MESHADVFIRMGQHIENVLSSSVWKKKCSLSCICHSSASLRLFQNEDLKNKKGLAERYTIGIEM